MMRNLSSILVAGALSLGAVGSAVAEDACQTAGRLASAAGSVMVDKGNGFTPGVIGTSLRNGDKISVQGPGQAVVDFGNDQTLTIPSSTTETVRAPGCGFGVTNSGAVNPTLGIFATIGAGVGAAALVSTAQGKSGTIFFPVSP